jgi:hypothetical protein
MAANAPKATIICALPVFLKFYLHGQASFLDFCIRPYLQFQSIYRHAGKKETRISEGKNVNNLYVCHPLCYKRINIPSIQVYVTPLMGQGLTSKDHLQTSGTKLKDKG